MQLSKELLNSCREYFGSKVFHGNDIQPRKLGSRIYWVCKITRYRIDFVNFLYDLLIKIVKEKRLPVLIEISSSHKSIMIQTNVEKPFWYKVGLTLSDGTLLDRYRLLFSSTNEYTTSAILQSFSNLIVYPAYYMVKTDYSKTTCSFNFLLKDPDVSNIVKKLKASDNYAYEVAEYLLKNYEYLVQFLAGIIDGDGSIDKDNVRISISLDDPIFIILSRIFKDSMSYDEKKYLLRISTSELRRRNLLQGILKYLATNNKREKLIKVINKRLRINVKIPPPQKKNISKLIQGLDHKDYYVLSQFKYRLHDKYTYAYIPVASKNLDTFYRSVITTFSKISDKIGVDITRTVKIGTREIIVYNQDVVKLIKTIQRNIKV